MKQQRKSRTPKRPKSRTQAWEPKIKPDPCAGMRRIRFPQRRSLGTLFYRDPDQDLQALTVLPDAQREVCFPPGKLLLLRVPQQFVASPAFVVANLLPDVRGLVLHSDRLRDGSLAPLAGLSMLLELDLADTRCTAEERTRQDPAQSRETRFGDAGPMHRHGPARRAHACAPSEERLGDAGLAHLRGLAALRVLRLARLDVSDAGLSQLAELTHLRRLFLKQTRVRGPGLAALRRLPELQDLLLHGPTAGDEAVAALAGFAALTRLSLSGAAVTDAGLAALGALPRLQSLSLGGTHVTDAGIERLRGLGALTRLYLHDTAVSDAGIGRLRQLRSLRLLVLRGSRVSDAGRARLRHELPGCTVR